MSGGTERVLPGPGDRVSMRGAIVSSGFESGDRVVVGHWVQSPVGPLTDVMWATPEGRRVLYVPTEEAGRFVSGVYRFDEVVVATVDAVRDARSLEVVIDGSRRLRFEARRGVPLPPLRPAWFTRFVEGPIARLLMGVVTYGESPTGVREWYRADRWAPLRLAEASVDGASLGRMRPVEPAARFGFSEPPRRPSWVDVRPLLVYPSPERTEPGRRPRLRFRK